MRENYGLQIDTPPLPDPCTFAAGVAAAARVCREMQQEWLALSHQDSETRLVAEVLGKAADKIRAIKP